MAFNLETIFGVHEKAIRVFGKRTEILANNIANADTPGFKSRDIDFKAILNGEQTSQRLALQGSNAKHFGHKEAPFQSELLYRIPSQPTLDGNTVEAQVEQVKFAQNALRYQASLGFINGKIRGLMTAIRGE